MVYVYLHVQKMPVGKRFLIGWIISSVVMFGLSYLWHGVFLNDYQLFIDNHRPGSVQLMVYIGAAVIAYLFIGFLVSKAFLLKYFDKISHHPLLRGPAAGFACGLLVYIISIVVQFNITGPFDAKSVFLDFVWQGIEQSIGGFVVGIVYMVVFEPFHAAPEEEA